MGKPIKTEEDYYAQMRKNEEVFMRLAKQVRPEWFVLLDLLEQTHVNPLILWKVIRHLHNVATGNRYGNVTIVIENGTVTFLRGEESDRINEPIIVSKKDVLTNQVDKV